MEIMGARISNITQQIYMNKKILGTGALALIIGFGGGYVLHSPAVPAVQGPSTRTGSAFRNSRGGTGFLTGTVISKDSGSITLNTRDGSSHIILITPDTAVSKSVQGALSDVVTGSTVLISGATNSDGSVSANIIQLRPNH